MNGALQGRTIALAEGRQLEELAHLLEREGATALRCPMVNILDAPDSAPVNAWLNDLIAGRFGLVIFMTGEGVRRLLGFAEKDGRRDHVIAALGRTRLLTRGPKPVRALKEINLAPAHVADAPTTDGVIAALKQETLAGIIVGVQLYADANPALVHFLEEAGAKAQVVFPYIYAPAADAAKVADLIDQMARGHVAAIVFTSSPQVERLYEVAAERGLQPALEHGLESSRVAAIGPVVAGGLRSRGVRIDVCPEQGFVMKNLVQQIKRDLTGAP
jgi:uroporphyrinogen-III synthase